MTDSTKTALITGITGQDGSFLAELLLEKNYQVVGLVSKKYNIGYENIAHIQDRLILEDGDLLDQNSVQSVLKKYSPREIYNLAGMTFVPASWEKPTLTIDINTLGVTRILELLAKHFPETRFYQASSSKIFGNPLESPQNEQTPLMPLDPYSISKTSSHQLIQIFRNHFNLFTVSGIMFNHESERRGPEFVTRKITQTAAKIKLGQESELVLGDLDAVQDWGYAQDYVEAMWLMLQQDSPDDYIIASGKAHTVRNICEIAFNRLNLNYEDFVKTDSAFMRKENIVAPLGDASKAKRVLGWEPKTSFEDMITKMVDHDLDLLQNT